jgi:hypothetical protein
MPTRKFSKTIAVTYIALGSFALLFSVAGHVTIWKAITSGQPALLLSSLLSLGIAGGFAYTAWSVHRRRWARYVALSFWTLCLIWSITVIVRNGPHPEAIEGPMKYANEQERYGGRLGALWTPYIFALVESTAIYCLLRKRSIVDQFQ